MHNAAASTERLLGVGFFCFFTVDCRPALLRIICSTQVSNKLVLLLLRAVTFLCFPSVNGQCTAHYAIGRLPTGEPVYSAGPGTHPSAGPKKGYLAT